MRNPLTIFLVTHDATKLFVSSGFSSQQILMRRPAALVIETLHYSFIIGGERGIRTLDTGLPYTHFPGVLLQPLGHLSKILNSYQLIQFHSDQNGDRAVSLPVPRCYAHLPHGKFQIRSRRICRTPLQDPKLISAYSVHWLYAIY